jgi:PAS domain S-box-containing protein
MEVNESFTKILGYERDAVIGRTTTDLHLWADPVSRERYVQIITDQKSCRNIDIGFRVRSGENRYGLLSAEKFQIGSEGCLLITIRDITDRKRVQAEVLREKRFSDTLISQLPGSLY